MTDTLAAKNITISFKGILKYVVMVLIMVLFHLLPPIGTITEYGMNMLGVFLALIYGWTFIGMLAPSLIGCFGLCCAGYGTLEQVLLGLFSNSNVLLMIVGSLAFDAIRQTNASDFLFARILTSPLAKKSSLLTVTAIFLLVLLMGLLGLGILLNFAIFPIMNDFLKKCGYKKGEKFSTLFLMGFFMAALMPISVLPFRGWGLMICGSLQSMTGYATPVLPYLVLNLLIYALFLLTYPRLMKLAGCDFSRLENVDIEDAFHIKKDVKLNPAQKITLFGLLTFIFLVVVCSFAPIPAVAAIYAQVAIAGLMMLYWAIMVMIKVDGKPILDMKVSAGFMSWDLIIMVATALLVSNAITGETTGVSQFLAGIIAPLVANTSQVVLIITVAVAMIVLTNLANNIAMLYVLLNLIAVLYANGVPINLMIVSVILGVASCTVAYLTPASSLPGAILFGGEMIEGKQVTKWCVPMMVYELVLLMVVCIPAAMLGLGM